MAKQRKVDFFISYNHADRQWAEWIAWQLEAANYTTILQAWDFRPGSNFVQRMQQATTEAARTIAILSPSYLGAQFTHPEWQAAFSQDPTGEIGLLVPVRVRSCELEGLLGTLIYIDLVDLDGEAAKEALLSGVHRGRVKPVVEPGFPGVIADVSEEEPTFPGVLPGVWSVPFPQNPFFTGRENVLVDLRARLTDPSRSDGLRFEGIFGLGGCGKSQVALEFAYRHRADYEAVIWLQAGSESQVRESLREAVQDCGIQEDTAATDFDTVNRDFNQWLIGHSDWLIVVDGADHPAEIAQYLPRDGNGHLLLTSRSPNLDVVRISRPIDLNVFESSDAEEFLIRRVGERQMDDSEYRSLRDLAAELGCLPLAAEQAAAFIAAKKSRFQDYLASYRHRRIELLEKMQPVTGGYPESVATTWSLNFQEIDTLSPASTEMLKMLAFLAPHDIPLELFAYGYSELTELLKAKLCDVQRDPLQIDELLSPLVEFSLVRRHTRRMTASVHQLVQYVIRSDMSDEEKQFWGQHVVNTVEQSFLLPTEYVHWPLCWRLLPHALLVVRYIETYGVDIDDPGYLLNRVAYFLTCQASYREARQLHDWALSLREAKFGDQDWRVAVTLHNLAGLAIEEGESQRAEDLLRRAISIYEKSDSIKDEDIAAAFCSLGAALTGPLGFTEAEQLLERSLRISKAHGDPAHFHTGTVMCNLATLNVILGKLNEAEIYANRSKEWQDKWLEPDDPERIGPLSLLARICVERKEYAQAESLLRNASDIAIGSLGPNHPNIGTVQVQLAEVALLRGESEGAERTLRSAIRLLRAILRPNHPRLATALEKLGVVYSSIGRLDDAKKAHMEAEQIADKNIGSESLSFADILASRGDLLRKMGQLDEANTVLRRALSLAETAPDSDDAAIAGHLFGLSLLSEESGDLGEAIAFAKRHLTLVEKAFAENEISLLYALSRLGTLQRAKGDLTKSIEVLRRTVEVATNCGDLDLHRFRLNLAIVLDQAGAHDEAKQLCDDALQSIEGGTVEDTVDIGRAHNLIGIRLVYEGRHEEAEHHLMTAFREWENAGWPNHRDAMGTLTNLSMLLIDTHRLKDAEPLCQKMAAMISHIEGIEVQQHAACYNTIAILHEEKHELGEAEKWYRKAYAVWEEAVWPPMIHSLYAIDNLVQNLESQGKSEATRPLLDLSLAQLKRIRGVDHDEVALRLNDVAGRHADLGDSSKAGKLYRHALEIWATKDWPNVPEIRNLQFNAAMHFMSCGMAELGERTARQAVEHAAKWLPTEDAERIQPLFVLGMVLSKKSRFTESEQALKEALRLMDAGPGDSHPCAPGLLTTYAGVLRAIGKQKGKARRMAARADHLREQRGDP